MKKIFLLLVIFHLTSCEKKIGEIDFTTNLSKTSDEIIVNNSPQRNLAGNFETSFVLDLSNENTKDYLNKLKDLDFEEVFLSFEGLNALSGNRTSTRLSIDFNHQVQIVVGDFKYDEVANGQKFRLEQTQALEEVAQILLNNKQVRITIKGNIPDTAVYHFYIKFLGKAHITAGIL